MAEADLEADYDVFADVLYLNIGEPQKRARSTEGPEGVVWRQSPEGKPQGVTVRNFNAWWSARREELVDLVSTNLDLPVRVVDSKIPALVH
jgi:hypothetical protein